jgi:DNA mismatch endonuclease, patch repair protein
MRKIKSKNTAPELLFQSLLRKEKIRYTTINDGLPGRPDIVLKLFPVAIFIDGEFWHGYKWAEKKQRIKKNRTYWIKKIENNMKRDKKKRRELRASGWSVVKFWEQEVRNNPEKCLSRIKRLMK